MSSIEQISSTKFDEFFRKDYPLLVGFLMKNNFDREEAEDATAEAMAKAYQGWSQINNPRSWVRIVAHRIAGEQARRVRDASRRAIIAGWLNPMHTDPDVAQIKEENAWLVRQLNKLPPQQRLVMAWHLDDFTNDEIAEHLKMKPATVRSHLRHARAKLKKTYQNEHGGPQPTSSDAGEE